VTDLKVVDGSVISSIDEILADESSVVNSLLLCNLSFSLMLQSFDGEVGGSDDSEEDMILFDLLLSLLLKGLILVVDEFRTTSVSSLNDLNGLVIAVDFFLVQWV